jgi:hypothetical protein
MKGIDTIRYGDTYLADAAAGDIVTGGGQWVLARAMQPRARLRARFGGGIDRANLTNTITLTVVREHTGPTAARQFVRDHQLALAAETATTILWQYTIPPFLELTLHDAVLTEAAATATGQTSTTRYTLVCGRIDSQT